MENPYVSIVTGTYNRLESLKRFLTSVRKSVGIGIPYEIILVDGGSTDGTVEWLTGQNDVVLIAQGKLLGACKAFNSGFKAAKGKYVIIANDDIEFRYESIQNSIAFMDDNLDVGIGCFPQNRLSADYTVSKMPAVKDGKKVWVHYGQVCIIPKWLGDRVGWWGDYNTYGGDNELSCNVLELGYKVVPMESCCINDYMIKDELRSVNNLNTDQTGRIPDSVKWINKWTRNGMIGPILKNRPVIPNPNKREKRIVYAPIYEGRQFQNQYRTKFGLRKALAEKFLVSEVDYRADPDELYYTLSMFNPDYALIQYHDPKLLTYDMMMKYRDEFKSTKFISWNGDYSEKMLLSNSYLQVAKLFDICTFVTLNYEREYANLGIDYRYWQIGFEEYPTVSEKDIMKDKYDIIFLGNCYSKERSSLGEMLRFHKEWNTKLYGSWPSHIGSDGNTMYDFAAGEILYRSSKIAVGDNQFPNSIGYVSNRLFQALHSGAFFLQQKVVGMEELLGFQDGIHLVIWNDLADLENKLYYWLDPERSSERNKIAKEGKRYTDIHHSFRSRVSELEVMLSDLDKK